VVYQSFRISVLRGFESDTEDQIDVTLRREAHRTEPTNCWRGGSQGLIGCLENEDCQWFMLLLLDFTAFV